MTNPTAHLKSQTPVTWLFTGDSITQGAVHTRGWRDYTQLFKERLGELGRNEDVVINTAVGGWSLGSFLPRFEERVTRFRPDVLLILFGTNDAAGGAERLEQFARDYATTLELAKKHGLDVIVQTPPLISPVDPDRFGQLTYADPKIRAEKVERLRTRQQFIEQYVNASRAAAAGNSALLVDHWSAWMRSAGTLGELTDGGFHPNEYGHRLMARTLFTALGIFDESSWTCRLFVPSNAART